MFDFKIVFMLTFSVLLALLGCSAKDMEPTNHEKLIGTWYEIDDHPPIQTYIDENGEEVEAVLEQFALTLSQDGTFLPENGRGAEIDRGGDYSLDEEAMYLGFQLETNFVNVFGYEETHNYEILELTEKYMNVIYHHTFKIGSGELKESHQHLEFERRD